MDSSDPATASGRNAPLNALSPLTSTASGSSVGWQRAAIAAVVAIGPLNPFAYGPSTAAYPQLLGLLLASLLIATAALGDAPLRRSAAAPWLLALSAFVALHAWFMHVSLTYAFVAVTALLVGALLQWRPVDETAAGLAWGLMIAAVINAAIGWLQFFNLAAALQPWLNVPAVQGVVYGNLRQQNQFATLMVMGLAAVWWLMRMRNIRKTWLVAAVLLLMSGVVLSGSRTGVLELLLFSAIAWCWRGALAEADRTLRWMFLALPLLYLLEWGVIRVASEIASLVMNSGVERFADWTGPSRRTLWHNVAVLITQQPWLGYGVHELGYAHFMWDFADSGPLPHYKGRHMELIDNAHNIVLHTWVELGLFGMLLTIAPLAIGTLRARPWREADAGRQAAWLIIAALGLHSLLEYPLNYAHFWIPFCLALAVVFTGAHRPAVSSRSRMGLLASACALAGVFVYAAWDYDRVSQAYSGPQRREPPPGVNSVIEAQKSVLFRPYARFAWLVTSRVTKDNAAEMIPLLEEALHFSAEPRVIERLITAYRYSGDDARAAFYAQRYKAAFPDDYARFVKHGVVAQGGDD